MTVTFNDVLISGNETLLHHAAVAGMGMAMLPRWLIADDLADGRLELVLPEATTLKIPLMAVYPSRKYLSAKVRTFIDFLAADPRLKQASEGPPPAIDVTAAVARKGRRRGG